MKDPQDYHLVIPDPINDVVGLEWSDSRAGDCWTRRISVRELGDSHECPVQPHDVAVRMGDAETEHAATIQAPKVSSGITG